MKLSVIYDSKTGNTKMAAEWTVEGMICFSGGGAYGLPVIHLGPVGVNNNIEKHNGMELYKDNFLIFGERFAGKTIELFK